MLSVQVPCGSNQRAGFHDLAIAEAFPSCSGLYSSSRSISVAYLSYFGVLSSVAPMKGWPSDQCVSMSSHEPKAKMVSFGWDCALIEASKAVADRKTPAAGVDESGDWTLRRHARHNCKRSRGATSRISPKGLLR